MPVNNTTSSYFFASSSSPDAVSSYFIPSGTQQQDAQSTPQQAARPSNADSIYVQHQGGYGSGVSATNSVYLSPHAAQGKNQTSTPAQDPTKTAIYAPSQDPTKTAMSLQDQTRTAIYAPSQDPTKTTMLPQDPTKTAIYAPSQYPTETAIYAPSQYPTRTAIYAPLQYPTKIAIVQLSKHLISSFIFSTFSDPTTAVLQPLMDRNYYEAPYSTNDEMSLSTRTAVMQTSATTAICHCQASAQPKGVGSTESVYFGKRFEISRF
jgi:hypothetical protein